MTRRVPTSWFDLRGMLQGGGQGCAVPQFSGIIGAMIRHLLPASNMRQSERWLHIVESQCDTGPTTALPDPGGGARHPIRRRRLQQPEAAAAAARWSPGTFSLEREASQTRSRLPLLRIHVKLIIGCPSISFQSGFSTRSVWLMISTRMSTRSNSERSTTVPLGIGYEVSAKTPNYFGVVRQNRPRNCQVGRVNDHSAAAWLPIRTRGTGVLVLCILDAARGSQGRLTNLRRSALHRLPPQFGVKRRRRSKCRSRPEPSADAQFSGIPSQMTRRVQAIMSTVQRRSAPPPAVHEFR